MRLPAAERRQQLLQSAISVFAEHGYHSASMNDVAERAGVTKPVLYQHFSSKRELFSEILIEIGKQLLTRIEKATAEAAGPRQQIENGFHAYFTFVASETDAFRVLFGAGARRDPEFAEYSRQTEATIAHAIADLIVVNGEKAEHADILAHGIVGMTESASRFWLANQREPDVEVVAEKLAQLAWSGLRMVRNPNDS